MGASTCNSIIIEIYVDIIRISHGFARIDMLFFIAVISTSLFKTENDDIIGFFGH